MERRSALAGVLSLAICASGGAFSATAVNNDAKTRMTAIAGNPILPGFEADPSARVFGSDRVDDRDLGR